MTEQKKEGRKGLYRSYPHSAAATRLSMAASVARLAAILMGVGAILMVVILAAAVLFARAQTGGMPLLWLLDEMDDVLAPLAGLVLGTVVAAFGAGLLSSRAAEVAASTLPSVQEHS
jgi:hypothetical protein